MLDNSVLISLQTLAAGAGSSQIHDRLSALPLWLSLQCLGYKGIVAKLKHAADLVSVWSFFLEVLCSTSIRDGLRLASTGYKVSLDV